MTPITPPRRLWSLCLVGLAALVPLSASAVRAAPVAASVAHGDQLFQYNCATCHGSGIGLNGLPHLPGTGALLAKYKGDKPALLEERTDLTPELVSFYVRNGVSIMPFFRKTEISDADLADIGAYLSRTHPRASK